MSTRVGVGAKKAAPGLKEVTAERDAALKRCAELGTNIAELEQQLAQMAESKKGK